MCFWRRCRRPAVVQTIDALVIDPQLIQEVVDTLETHPPAIPPAPAPIKRTMLPVPNLPRPKPVTRETVSRTSQHWSFSETSSSSPKDETDSDSTTSCSSVDEENEETEENDEEEEEEEEVEDLLGWHESGHDGKVTPLYNIYIDDTTMNVRFNTVHQETRETLSERVVRNYVNHTITSGQVICQLQDVLHNIDIPTDASHMIVTFYNFAGDQFSVPFALDHPYDPFPFEDTRFITDCQLDELPQTLVMIHRPHPDGPVVEENLSAKMIHFCWKDFRPGFSKHRPYAWSWMSEMSEDPEAVLQAKYDHDRFVCLQLATSELIVYRV